MKEEQQDILDSDGFVVPLPTQPKSSKPMTPLDSSGMYGLLLPKDEPKPEEEKVSYIHAVKSDETYQTERLERAKEMGVDLVYEPPFWSAPPKIRYFIEVIKDGVVKEQVCFGYLYESV
eukprot:TRINITY_DN1288_c0_g1_i1.p1 TRINITY_DN1288_c0_g1~~TRINITY_DN1288_c0_g1_i1.p1  ORF type:complete len:119 (-),score=24.30 TRINITY_DN1288_c0_g1_i1:167-523(-)